MFFIIGESIIKVSEFQNHTKNWLGAACGLGLHQKENSNQITYKQFNKVM